MHIEISYHNLPHSEKLDEHVNDTLHKRLGRFEARITRVEVHLGDVNESKKGPDDKRCMIEVRPAGKDPIAVEEHADDPYHAVSEAAKNMVRVLEKKLPKDH